MFLRNGVDGRMLKEQRGILSMLKIKLKETQRTERRVSSHSNALLLSIVHQASLREVRVVLDLQCCGANAGIAQQIHQQLGAEVANANAAGQLLVNEAFHSAPCLVDGCVGELDLAFGSRPAGRVSHGGIQVLQGDGEVNDVQVEIIDAPVSELLARDGLDLVGFVEAVPELGDDEELLALDETVLDGTSYTLAGFDLIAVVYGGIVNGLFSIGKGWGVKYRRRRRTGGSQP